VQRAARTLDDALAGAPDDLVRWLVFRTAPEAAAGGATADGTAGPAAADPAGPATGARWAA
jgi:hypothetical protein